MRQLRSREDATKKRRETSAPHCVAPWRAEADYHRPARKPAGRMAGRGLRLLSREVAMKKTIVSAFLFAAACTAGLAQAQTAAPASQEFQYPSVRSRTAASRRPRPCASPSRARVGAGAGGDQRYPGQQVRVRTLSPGLRTAPRCRTRRCRPAWRNACASWSSAASSSSRAARTAGRGRSGAGPGFRVVMGITFTLIDFRPAQGPEL